MYSFVCVEPGVAYITNRCFAVSSVKTMNSSCPKMALCLHVFSFWLSNSHPYGRIGAQKVRRFSERLTVPHKRPYKTYNPPLSAFESKTPLGCLRHRSHACVHIAADCVCYCVWCVCMSVCVRCAIDISQQTLR